MPRILGRRSPARIPTGTELAGVPLIADDAPNFGRLNGGAPVREDLHKEFREKTVRKNRKLHQFLVDSPSRGE
jgi:hypothetical protein